VKNAIRLAVLAFAIAFCIAACGGEYPTDITYTAVQLGGTAGTADSTGIYFNFSAAVTGLTASDISVTNGTGSVTKETLTGSETSWVLGIAVTTAGNITVSINKSGIQTSAKTVAVYKQSGISYNAEQTGGTAGTTTSTGIVFTFGASVDSFNLSATDISVGGVASKGGPASAGEATLSGSGTSWTLSPITVNSEGTATVSINKSGIQAGTKNVPVYKKAGPVWTTVTSTFGTTNTINAVTWGGGVFVAVGASGKIAYSADGISWTAVSDSKFGTSAINCVAWGDGKFMAGGEGGKLASSVDGSSWELVSNSSFSSSQAINGIVWGSDKWAAVGTGRTAYSANGTNWTGASSNDAFNYQQGAPNLRGVAFGNGTFVLVGPSGGQAYGSSLASSTNGINWTARNIGNLTQDDDYVTSVCFGNGKFIARNRKMILYSSNGTSWDKVAGLSSSINLYGVAAGNGKFAAVGANNAILFSNDGISWTPLTGVSIGSVLNDVAYGNGTWVAVGMNGTIAYYIDE